MGTYSTAQVIAAFEQQAAYCRSRRADLTASIIEGAIADLRGGGPLAAFIGPVQEDPSRSALALRLTGALHYIARKGRAGPLQPYYDDLCAIDAQTVRRALATLLASEAAALRGFLTNPPQTNESNRMAVLLPALLEVAQRWSLPIDLYELGASGGLLLAPDHCSVDYGAFSWGQGPLGLTCDWRGASPTFPPALTIRNRRGCDRNPIDFSDTDQCDVMRAYLWPEQAERRMRFEDALKLWAELTPRIEKADALDWLDAQALPFGGAISVLFTSAFAVYLDDVDRARLQELVDKIGAQASEVAPFAFIQFEPAPELDFREFHLDLTVWPGGARRRIAIAHSHGEWVEPASI